MRSHKAAFFLSRFLLLLLALLPAFSAANAADLPIAAGSPLAGIGFDDRPLLLPVQRNFQMAMLTAASELGRSCGKMEAYGWRMAQSEQQRVNVIFNNTVDRLRGLGFSIELQAPSSISRDITLFTADRNDKHFLFMWSAGEIGLVMTLCQSSPPVVRRTPVPAWANATNFPRDVVQSKLEAPIHTGAHKKAVEKFSPVGNWVGEYSCAQGYTGGTLQINSVKGEDFNGVFYFYPTLKNLQVPAGSYSVFGQYDKESQRILINPGKWISRPKNFYNTVIIGSFDPVMRTLSAYFQGISGCTSFEAKYESSAQAVAVRKGIKLPAKPKAAKKSAHKSAKGKVVKAAPPPVPAATIVPDTPATIHEPPMVAPAPATITLPPPAALTPSSLPTIPTAPAPAVAVPATIAPPLAVAPAPTPTLAPPTVTVPAVTAPATGAPAVIAPPASDNVVVPPTKVLPLPKASGAPPPLPKAAPLAPVPSGTSAPAPSGTSAPAPTGTSTPAPDQHSHLLKPPVGAHMIMLASSGEWITPNVPQAPPAQRFIPNPPKAPQATVFQPTVRKLPPAPTAPQAERAEPAHVFVPQVPQLPPAGSPPPAERAREAEQAPDAVRFTPHPPAAPEATWVNVPPGPQAPEPQAQTGAVPADRDAVE